MPRTRDSYLSGLSWRGHGDDFQVRSAGHGLIAAGFVPYRVTVALRLPCSALAATALLALVGCGGGDNDDGGASAGSGAAGGAGVADCGPGALVLDDGTCMPAGVPADACGAGFMSDGADGCTPVLPAAPCARGTMAVPGETVCRPVGTCGEGTWGEIPVDADTQYVDAAYAGGDSDGSAERPWSSVSDGIAAASVGAIVALAAGTYVGDFQIANATGGAVRVWGRCPELVELVGEGVKLGTVWIRDGADGTEIRDLAISGPRGGVFVTDARDVLLERVWIHDTGERGLHVEDYEGPATATLRASLIEGTRRFGIYVMGESATVEASVVRDVTPYADADPLGRGLQVEDDAEYGRSSLVVTGSLVERVAEMGVSSVGSDLVLEDTVVRDVAFGDDGLLGRGVNAEDDPYTGAEQTLTMRRSVVLGARQFGLFIAGVTGLIEHTTVAGTQADGAGEFGRGVAIQVDPDTGRRSEMTVSSSVVAASSDVGFAVHGSTVVMQGVVVRDTVAEPATQWWGYGVAAQPQAGQLAHVELRGCRVERNRAIGVAVLGSDAIIDRTLVSDTAARDDGVFGDGLSVRLLEGSTASVTVTGSRVERSARAGIGAFGASVILSATALECNAIDLDREVTDAVDASFDNQGQVVCSCDGESRECQVSQAQLAPPEPPAAFE
jgi:hypothetical protein